MPTQNIAPQRILCLYTGGTIGCIATPHGLAPAANVLQQPIAELVSMATSPQCQVVLREYPQLLDSSSMGPKDWLRIATDINDNYADFDGFIVLHGTDTLAWTAAALHWQLAQIDKPVVITGSMRPWLASGSDAPANFSLALNTVCSQRMGVIVAFGDKLLPGYAVKKLDSDADCAFTAPNWQGQWPAPPTSAYQFHPVDPLRQILAVKLFPGTQAWLAQSLNPLTIDGIALETYGSGNLPNDPALKTALQRLALHGTIIINCSQCIAGEVRQGHYAASDLLQQINAFAGGRMSIEAATTWLYTAIKPDLTCEALRKAWQSAQLVV